LEAQLADLERYLVEALQPHEAALQLLMTMPESIGWPPRNSWSKSVLT